MPIINKPIVANTPDAISNFRLLSMRQALKLEIKGLRRRGPSVYSIVKSEFGFRGSMAKVLEQFESMLREKGLIQ